MPRFKNQLSFAPLRFCTAVFVLIVSCSTYAADTLTIAATGTAMPMLKILIADFARLSPDLKIDLLYPPAGSGGAIRGVAIGKVDLGVTSRQPKPGLPGADLLADPWVKTAFVIAANHSNVAKSYTLEDLAAIWSGRTMVWPDGGGPMRLVIRLDDDADTIALRAMSSGMSRAVDAALSRKGLPRADHDLHNLELLGKVPGAVGSSSQGLLLSSGSRLTALNMAGVTPTIRSVRDGTYPYQRTLYLVSHSRLRNHPFLTYLHSARANTLLEANGFVKSAP